MGGPLASAAGASVENSEKPRSKMSCLPCKRRMVECIWPKEDRRTTRFHPKAEASVTVVSAQGGPASSLSATAIGNTLDLDLTTLSASEELHSTQIPSFITTGNDDWLQWLVGSPGMASGSGVDVDSERASNLWPAPASDIGDAIPVTLKWNDPLDTSIGEPLGITQGQGYAFPLSVPSAQRTAPSSRVIRVKWYRPHGRTAYEAGVLPMTLDVTVRARHSPDSSSRSISDTDPTLPGGAADVALKMDLIDIFERRFGAEFPYIDIAGLKEDVATGRGSQFLLFSDNPILARSGVPQSEYGDKYIEQAKSMIGSVMAIPVRETVIGFILLTYGISWRGVATEFWMLSGLAIRLAIDMGLHLAPAPGLTDDDAQKDRLVFWTVMMLDFVVSLGVGRTTMISPSSVTQCTPFAEDMVSSSPLTHLARLILPIAQIGNALNSDQTAPPNNVDFLKGQLVGLYGALPHSAMWSTQNLRNCAELGQATVFIACHLWVHAILLTDSSSSGFTFFTEMDLNEPVKSFRGQDALDNAEAICEILAACEAIKPEPYLAFPFISQALYHAAMVFLEVIEDVRQSQYPTSSIRVNRAFAKLQLIQNVFTQLGVYWPGCRLIASALEQRISGQSRVSFVPDPSSPVVPRVIDAGLLPTRFDGQGDSF